MTTIGPSNLFSQELHQTKYRAEGESFDDYAIRYARAASDSEEHFRTLLGALREQRILPAGRQQLAVGREFSLTASNCFVSGTIDDSMSGIMRSCTEAALTLRMGGGVGTDFSAIRPSGEPIRGLGLKAFSSGPISFMSIWNAMSSTVMSAGHRRGALMGILRVDHPDAMAFIRAKADSASLTNFNISLAVTDAFMEALAVDGLYDLQWNGRVFGQARATDVWAAIMQSNWDWAEPGVLFIDRANADNNLWYCETFAATNPCVTGDTEILTNTGNRKIADCVGETVTIWNGWQWSDVEPKVTGTDQPIIAVELDNGALIRCTPYHKFILAAGHRVEAKELRPGDELAKFTMPEIAGPFDPERVIRVVSIATAGIAEYVYCFTDSANNSGVFNGVMLGNCAEQWLPPYGACLLASLNIPKYLTGTGYTLRDASKPAYEFNWEQFDIDVEATVRALDNVIDRSTYPLPQQRAEQIAKRRMGLGCTGMANALEMQGIPYGSPAYIAAQSDILARLRNVAYIASVKLAQEKGAFPLYDARYLTGKFIKTLPDYIIASIAKHGIRNALLLSIAPTGTISLTADNVSSGIEPPYSLQSKRLVHMPDGQREVALDDYAFAKAGVRGRTAYEVTPEQHVDVLCAAQRYVDNSVSKTCNVNGKEFGFGPFKDLYRRGYEGGAKGIALFNISGKRFGIMASASDEKNVEGACTIDPISGIKSCAA